MLKSWSRALPQTRKPGIYNQRIITETAEDGLTGSGASGCDRGRCAARGDILAVDMGALSHHHAHRRLRFCQSLMDRDRCIETAMRRDRDLAGVVVTPDFDPDIRRSISENWPAIKLHAASRTSQENLSDVASCDIRVSHGVASEFLANYLKSLVGAPGLEPGTR